IKECANLLFDEMRASSLPFAAYGQYRHLINSMLTHMQTKNGEPFNHSHLNLAYRNLILGNKSTNSTYDVIEKTLNKHADYINNEKSSSLIRELQENISNSILPKFDAFSDRFNGMGITIHDVHATKIDLLKLNVTKNQWRAQLKFTAQDHFGLDDTDIRNKKFYQFQFFRIWFLLQRYDKFGFRPFMTNMEAVINMQGTIQ
ncbi:DUF3289 family protein, partial [Cronobacter sakazakii]|nr:DUF3289 family protein [Cronobacter sakazakii]